jgi:riboflavin-specific deaminase-like protein
LTLRRILPDHRETTPFDATTGFEFAALAPPERPYIALNMVATADGAASLGGRTRELSDPTDRAIFHGLRTQVDCVMVGAGTVRTERYGRLARDAEARERRVEVGLDPDPLACIVSGRLALPADLPMLADTESRVVVMTGSDGDITGAAAKVDYLRASGGDELLLAPLVARLRAEHGVRSVLCEGGPHLNRSLLAERLVDEVFLTLAPKLVGGAPETTIVAGAPPDEPLELELVSVHESAGGLYLRYRVRP